MQLKTFGLLLATYGSVGAFSSPPVQPPRKVSLQVVDLAPEGMVLARIAPAPYVIASSDKPLAPGDRLTCTLEVDYLDCGDAIVKPLGFVVHADIPDLRADTQPVPRSR